MQLTLADVLHRLHTVHQDQCLEWPGCRVRNGYGQVRIGARMVYAHRATYEAMRGPIPDGLQLDHLCRNRACVNPAHLEPVTARENIHRGNGVAGINARKTHCKRGHGFTPENTLLSAQRGGRTVSRVCRTCKRERQRRGC